jgi:oligoendopeptidase F
MEEIETVFTNLVLFANLKQSVNTADAESASILGRLMAKLSSTAAPRTAFYQYIAGIGDLEGAIASDALLTEYAYMLRNIKKDGRYLLEKKTEEALSLLSISGSGAWGDLQQYLTSTVPVMFRERRRTFRPCATRRTKPTLLSAGRPMRPSLPATTG